MSRRVTFAYPGVITTPTGGYIYDIKMIAGLRTAGYDVTELPLGDGFPNPDEPTRKQASDTLLQAAHHGPVIIDGLALGVLPEVAARMAEHAPLIALVHHPLALETGVSEPMAKTFQLSEASALSHAFRVIATSPTTARILHEDYHVAANVLRVALPGNEPARFFNKSGGETASLLSVAAISQRKGFDILIAALAELKHLKWKLTIAGDRSRAPEVSAALDHQIELAGLSQRIIFNGSVSAGQIEKLYESADIFVLASRYEGYGMAYAEALAHGLPVIGTTGGAIPDVVPADAGILVPPGEVTPLIEALASLIENRSRRAQLIVGARRAAMLLPRWESTVAVFIAALKEIDGEIA